MATIDYSDGDQLATIATLLETNKTEIIGDVLKEIINDFLYTKTNLGLTFGLKPLRTGN